MLEDIRPSKKQLEISQSPVDTSLFLSGPYASGKTTAALLRIQSLLREIPANRMLIITPQLSLAAPYSRLFAEGNLNAHTRPNISTMSGLCRQSVNLFWPVIAKPAGFKEPKSPPNFLSLETAQFCLGRIVDPLLDKGYFQALKIERNRLLSQILDNLNKTAINDLPISEIYPRLSLISTGSENLEIPFQQAQECARKFRQYCLDHNLIDFSLLLSIFSQSLLNLDLFQNYFHRRYDILIAENLEEDTVFTHNFIRQTIKGFRSALLIKDDFGGYRTFLGANPESANGLEDICEQSHTWDEEFDLSAEISSFRNEFKACIRRTPLAKVTKGFPAESELSTYQFYPQMIFDVSDKIKSLVDGGTTLENIAVLSPYLSDSLKYNQTQALAKNGIPTETNRPSRSYISASSIQALIAFARLAYPAWGMPLTTLEFRRMLLEILPDLDLIRADILTRALFVPTLPDHPIRSFDELTNAELQQRITFSYGARMMEIRAWLDNYFKQDDLPLDIFMQKVFGELLSQKKFAWFDLPEVGNAVYKLINSIRNFRLFLTAESGVGSNQAGLEYIISIRKGLIPGSFYFQQQTASAVQISPAFTFLMQNRTVDYQFWLDVGSLGWWERLNQPLTNPYIFSSAWNGSKTWEIADDFDRNQAMMERTIHGLLSRCRKSFFAATVQINEFGAENRGPLLQAFQTFLKRSQHGGRDS